MRYQIVAEAYRDLEASSARLELIARLADLFRQIGYDERLHKQESEGRMVAPRFT